MSRFCVAVRAVAVVLVLGSCLSLARANEPDPPAGDPVDASNYTPPTQPAAQPGQPLRMIMQPAYRSDTLRGDFLAQFMILRTPGRNFVFWGARAMSLDPDSPLSGLGLKAGDVVTRVDGIGIANNMFQDNGVWQIPELERHFGRSQIRFIRQGTRLVQNGDVQLDNSQLAPPVGPPLIEP